MSRQGSYEEKNDCIGISWRYNPLVTDVEAAGGIQLHGLAAREHIARGGSIQTTVGPFSGFKKIMNYYVLAVLLSLDNHGGRSFIHKKDKI